MAARGNSAVAEATPRTNDLINEVRLVGRLSGREIRVLPSGAQVLTFRVIVDRPPRDRGPSGSVRVDALDCCVWTSRLIARIEAWNDGDQIEVGGVLRRRFWQTGVGPNSRVEVEVKSARRQQRT